MEINIPLQEVIGVALAFFATYYAFKGEPKKSVLFLLYASVIGRWPYILALAALFYLEVVLKENFSRRSKL